jgi:hypothetical protein
MSRRIRRLERGAADLVTVAVGITIVAIAAIGTSYSLLYGRQALIHQEHYKTALYKLRGFVEEQTARVRFASIYRENSEWMTQPQEQRNVALDTPTDRDGEMLQTVATLWRERIDYKDDPLTRKNPDYYRVTAYAEWEEAVVPGDNFAAPTEASRRGPNKRIKLVADCMVPD